MTGRIAYVCFEECMLNIIAKPGENESLGEDRLSFEGNVKINLKEREYIEAKVD
jgi:hypothetical protein